MYTQGHHNNVYQSTQGIMNTVSIQIGHINVYTGSSYQCVSRIHKAY